MPPTRTIPPVKAIKTERTHEENQERAYIAASRRSDRSLEARVESARRASEIHKRRTGRSLRVTEQDVINEEMYEEEDDDLPLQYRRLTAHLQTGSADFNRRLAAYLTNQVAMRSAVGQMVNGPYGPQYPTHFQPNMFQSPMMPHQQAPLSPGGYARQAPYPSPHLRPNHGRAYSTAVPQKAGTPPTPGHQGGLDHRRMSTPASIHTNGPPHLNVDGIKADNEYLRQTQSATFGGGHFQHWQENSPFTTTLPPESQQMLAGTAALDPSDPFSAMMMTGSENYMTNPYYPWNNMQHGIKGMPVHPSAYPVATPSTSGPNANDGNAPSAGLDFGLGHGSTPDSFKRENSHQSLGDDHLTPGDGFWDNFVHDGSWHEDSTVGN